MLIHILKADILKEFLPEDVPLDPPRGQGCVPCPASEVLILTNGSADEDVKAKIRKAGAAFNILQKI